MRDIREYSQGNGRTGQAKGSRHKAKGPTPLALCLEPLPKEYDLAIYSGDEQNG